MSRFSSEKAKKSRLVRAQRALVEAVLAAAAATLGELVLSDEDKRLLVPYADSLLFSAGLQADLIRHVCSRACSLMLFA